MANIIAYKCPNCGSDIPYNPSGENLKCAYCDTEYPIATLQEYNEETIKKDNECNWSTYNSEEMMVNKYEYHCPSCGGSVIFDETGASDICPYCGSAIILGDKVDKELKPDLILPFEIDKETALKSLKTMLKTKFMVPKAFKENRFLDKVQALYVPYWLFDCESDCSANFRCVRSRTWVEGDYRYTKTSHYLAIRKGKMAFEKVPVDASLKLDAKLLQSLEPFDYSKIKTFDTAYLAQIRADVRQEEAKNCQNEANERIYQSMIATLESTVIDLGVPRLDNANITYDHGTSSYTFMPVYLLSRQFKDKTYTFAINGQNGKVAGDLPFDYFKLITLSFIIFLFAFIISSLLIYYALM